MCSKLTQHHHSLEGGAAADCVGVVCLGEQDDSCVRIKVGELQVQRAAPPARAAGGVAVQRDAGGCQQGGVHRGGARIRAAVVDDVDLLCQAW